IPVILRKRIPFLWILHRNQPLPVEITSDKVPRGNRHSFEYACADHSCSRYLMDSSPSLSNGKSKIQYPEATIAFIGLLLPSRYQRSPGFPSRRRRYGQGTYLPES